jgi:YidC/Oxa1 family membrane protein insertase
MTSKYFLVALVPDSVRDADIDVASFAVEDTATGRDEKKNAEINYAFMYERSANGQSESFDMYVGPAQLTRLKEWDIGLQKVLFGGWRWFFRADLWFPAICEFVLWLLIQLQKVVLDYGIVIVLLTVLLKVVTFPMTHSSMKSMARMKDMQPKINAIREKYKNQPKKMNEKLMAMYREEGVNPLNPGCLPMFLQMPIFISLFVVLRKSIELRGAETFLVPWVQDLSQPEVLFGIPFTIPFYGSNVALLPIVMAVLTYFQNKATIKDPNQKAMIYFMPVMMLVLFNNFPAGLVLYWTFSSALQLVQQRLIDRGKRG